MCLAVLGGSEGHRDKALFAVSSSVGGGGGGSICSVSSSINSGGDDDISRGRCRVSR